MCDVLDIVNYTHNFHHHTPRDPVLKTSPTPIIIIRSYLEQSTRTHRHTKVKPQWAELVLSGEPLENPWCRMVFVFVRCGVMFGFGLLSFGVRCPRVWSLSYIDELYYWYVCRDCLKCFARLARRLWFFPRATLRV